MKRGLLLPLLVVSASLVACDEKKEGAPAAASASATPAATTTASAASTTTASASAAPAASASAAPAASGAADDTKPAKDATVTVRDPVAEPKKTVRALPGGSVTLYLPEYAGTKWTVTSADKALGKPKEETIPGFAGPTTPAKQLTWQTASVKAGQTFVVQLANTKKGEAKADKTFALTIEIK